MKRENIEFARKYLKPLFWVKHVIDRNYVNYLRNHNLKKLADYMMKSQFGKMNWKNPQTLNEKIQWLKFYGDTSLWSDLSDKYKVRDYVAKKGMPEILTTLYGKWDSVDDIDWDGLPNQFVMKMNNGCGDVLICRDKSKIDVSSIKYKYSELFNLKFGKIFAEPHYDLIKPCIIAEELLPVDTQPLHSTTLVDYKIWCFDGVPKYVLTCYNRTKHTVDVGTYDLNWNYHSEYSIFNDHYRKGEVLPKPKNFEMMLEIGSLLSMGFPQVRVDLYNIDGKIYFGEMTFTSQGGYMPYYTDEFQRELGSYVNLK